MCAADEEEERRREESGANLHPECFVCAAHRPNGLGIRFRAGADGSIRATFERGRLFQGYRGMVHGGVISAILDGAMTHCLFARGKGGVTARLIVRFLRPVGAGRPAEVRAWLKDYSPPLYVLESELSQDGKVAARATAKFIDLEEVEPVLRDGREIPESG